MNVTASPIPVINCRCVPLPVVPTQEQLGQLWQEAWAGVVAQLAFPRHEFTLWVPGPPEGEDRHRSRVNPKTGKSQPYKSAETKRRRAAVLAAFKRVCPNWNPWTGPVKVDIIDCHPETKEFWLGKHCVALPDCDNSYKLVGDALNGFAWSDDRKIPIGVPAKTYLHTPGKLVRIRFYDPVPEPKHGRVKGIGIAGCSAWFLYDRGALFGEVSQLKCSKRWLATYYKGPARGDRMNAWNLHNHEHPSGLFRTVTEAEAKIREACLNAEA